MPKIDAALRRVRRRSARTASRASATPNGASATRRAHRRLRARPDAQQPRLRLPRAAARRARRARDRARPSGPRPQRVRRARAKTTARRCTWRRWRALIARLDVDEVDWVGTSLGGHIGMEFAARAGRADPPPGAQRLRRAHPGRVRCSASARYLRRAHVLRDARRRSRRTCARSTRRSATSPTRSGATSPCTASCRTRTASACTTIPAIVEQFSRPILLDVVLWRVWDHVDVPDADPARRALRPAARADRGAR